MISLSPEYREVSVIWLRRMMSSTILRTSLPAGLFSRAISQRVSPEATVIVYVSLYRDAVADFMPHSTVVKIMHSVQKKANRLLLTIFMCFFDFFFLEAPL